MNDQAGPVFQNKNHFCGWAELGGKLGLGLALIAAAGFAAQAESAGPENQPPKPGRAGRPPQFQPPYQPPPPPPARPKTPPYTRPRHWQLPPGWQRSMGFGPPPVRPDPPCCPGYYYYYRPGRPKSSGLEFDARWSGPDMGPSLEGRPEAPPPWREDTWSIWLETPAPPKPPSPPAEAEPVDNYDYQYEQWRKTWE